MTYASHVFELAKVQEDGASLESHLKAVERQTGVRPEELNLPEFPELLAFVWRIFTELSNSRNQGFGGASPITFEQMQAYNAIMGNLVGPFEAQVVLKLDREYLRIMNSG